MDAEQTPRSPLAIQTVAHSDYFGLTFTANNELPASAFGFTYHKGTFYGEIARRTCRNKANGAE